MSDPDPPFTEHLIPTPENSDGVNIEVAAIYARTSPSSREFNYSIDEQVKRCWARCDEMDWAVRYVFTDEDESGRDAERPHFQEMLEKAEQGLFDVVVFWKLDRFCRSLVDLVKTEEKLDGWDVALHSVTEFLDTTSPVGRFNFRNLASAAELESDLTSQRVKLGMRGLAKELKWPNDLPPLGYDRSDDGTLVVNREEADLVRRIFRLYLEERSMPQVAYILNEEGIRTKRGKEWRRQSVKKVLSNELYIGEYCVAGYEEYVEEYRILSDDLYNQVKETRYRFQNANQPVDKTRKESKAGRILTQYKEFREGGQ